MSRLDLQALAEAPVQRDPCPFVIVPRFVHPEALASLDADYPAIEGPGNFPIEDLRYGPAFEKLLEELASDDVRRLFERKFDVSLEGLPLQTTIRRFSEASDGNIHNDSRGKIVTALIYFNEVWPHEGGRLRILRDRRDIDSHAGEVVPAEGNLIAFRRSERSFHGFRRVVAERRSLQMYWVKPKRETVEERKHTLRRRLKRRWKQLKRAVS